MKDAFHRYVVDGEKGAVNPARTGTKAAAHYVLDVPGGRQSQFVQLPPPQRAPRASSFGAAFDEALAAAARRGRRVLRADHAALADARTSAGSTGRRSPGCSGRKQYYYFDVDRWLKEHEAHPLLGGAGRGVRNAEWFHMLNDDVISMPDKWEYPWYAAWDLAFHTIALSLVDFDFAKEQLAPDAAQPLQPPERADARRTSGTSAT